MAGIPDGNRDRASRSVPFFLHGCSHGPARSRAARTLRSLTRIEQHGLPFAQVLERCAGARGLMEEVFVSILRRNEPETLVADETLNGAFHLTLLVEGRSRDRPNTFNGAALRQ